MVHHLAKEAPQRDGADERWADDKAQDGATQPDALRQRHKQQKRQDIRDDLYDREGADVADTAEIGEDEVAEADQNLGRCDADEDQSVAWLTEDRAAAEQRKHDGDRRKADRGQNGNRVCGRHPAPAVVVRWCRGHIANHAVGDAAAGEQVEDRRDPHDLRQKAEGATVRTARQGI